MLQDSWNNYMALFALVLDPALEAHLTLLMPALSAEPIEVVLSLSCHGAARGEDFAAQLVAVGHDG